MLDRLRSQLGERLRENEPLAGYTNFRIGGPAQFFFEAQSSTELIKTFQTAQSLGLPFFILGGGSDVLIADDGFRGLVIKAANRYYEIIPERGRVLVEAGVLASFLARKTAEAGLAGLEWAISLPGTMGGGIFGNAGCFGGEMGRVVKRVRIMDPELGIKELTADQCQFGYRDSIFKHLHPRPVILSAEFELAKDDPTICQQRLEEKLAQRREKQPLESSSAGCIFKNALILPGQVKLETGRRCLPLPEEFIFRGQLPAAWLIEQAGLKGRRQGEAMISEKHANFILNLGQATAREVKQLIDLVKKRVVEEFGIELVEEVQLIGF